MSLTQFARRSRPIAVAVAAGLALTVALGNPADAVKPDGSRATVMLETGDATGNPANAITSGWWGHEGGAGPAGTGTTFLSLDASDGNGTVNDASIAALLAAMGTDDLSKISYAIVPTTADGSNEAPTVSAGENAAEAFDWVMYQGFGNGLNGSTATNDSVATVSTLAQVTAWVQAGRPVQNYDNSLVLHDATAPGNPVSTAPQGSSILNTWPAGTQLSLVAYVTNGMDADLDNQVPLVAVGADGKAKTAWMPFTTVANPSSAIRTSAGYQVVGAYAPTITLSSSVAGSAGSLTATIKNKSNATATDATGNVEFAPVVNGVRGTATAVPVANGVATLSITGFTPGTTKTYDVRYVPDAPAQATYLTTDYTRKTLLNPVATTTALSVRGGSTDTITATVTPGAAGKVTFKDGSTVIGALSVSPSVRTVKVVRKLTAGKHIVSAIFTPSNPGAYKASSAAKAVWQPRITTALKPLRPARGTRPKLTVRVAATGAVVSGRVTLVFDPPKGLTKRITVTLRAGAVTVALPRVVRGLTRVTVMYLGNTQVLAANKAISFRVS